MQGGTSFAKSCTSLLTICDDLWAVVGGYLKSVKVDFIMLNQSAA